MAQWFEHRADLWDVDLRPNFWINGFDVELDKNRALKKVLNQAHPGAKYNATAPLGHVPIMGGGDGQKTLKLDGTQYLTCPMNWNLDEASNNSLQTFVDLKHDQMSTGKDGFHGAVFGHYNDGWDQFVAYFTDSGKTYLVISGATHESSIIEEDNVTIGPTFSSTADPTVLGKFFVLSVHWNFKGAGTGVGKSSVWVSGVRLLRLLRLLRPCPLMAKNNFILGP